MPEVLNEEREGFVTPPSANLATGMSLSSHCLVHFNIFLFPYLFLFFSYINLLVSGGQAARVNKSNSTNGSARHHISDFTNAYDEDAYAPDSPSHKRSACPTLHGDMVIFFQKLISIMLLFKFFMSVNYYFTCILSSDQPLCCFSLKLL